MSCSTAVCTGCAALLLGFGSECTQVAALRLAISVGLAAQCVSPATIVVGAICTGSSCESWAGGAALPGEHAMAVSKRCWMLLLRQG